MKHKGKDIPKYFRLEQLQEESSFVSEEEMKKSKRFRLLQLRNAGQLGIFPLQQIPLYDREIPDSVFQVHGFYLSITYKLMFCCFKSVLIFFN